MAQDLAALTNTWMVNPTMFDPSQASNQFSNYNGAALPWPPTYNGAPVNAATGRPIQSFQQWQQQNPGGMSINATPAQPPQAPAASNPFANVPNIQGQNAPATEPRGGLNIADWQALSPAQRSSAMGPMGQYQAGLSMMPSGNNFVASGSNPSGGNPQASNALAWMNSGLQGYNQMQQGGAPPQAGQQGGGAGAPPNNWQQAINSLANPGNPVTQGATVPQVTGYQPAGGVNNAFLQAAGQGQGMSTNFLNALRQIQNRPQQ
jgi:hypothetical protein